MNKYSVELDRQLEIMSKYELSAEEWFMVQLLFLASEPESKPQYLHTYFKDCKKTLLPKACLEMLKAKRILSSTYKVPDEGEVFDVRKIAFSKSFLKSYMKSSLELGAELFDKYPSFLQLSNGRLVSAKNITKSFINLEEFFFAYAKSIKHDVAMHERVLKSLEYAISANLIHYGISEYVISRKYIEHEQLMNGTLKQDVLVTFDNVEEI